jgi:hypothetical protein
VNQAIREIQSGAVQYFTRFGDRVVPVQVVGDGRGGNYLRSQADATEQNNPDNLPSWLDLAPVRVGRVALPVSILVVIAATPGEPILKRCASMAEAFSR